MAAELTEAIVATIKDAARQLRGQAKRAFQARVAIDYLHGSARRAETVFSWGREAVCKGLEELEGLPVPGKANQVRGDAGRERPKAEKRLGDLEADVRSLVEPQSQADPKFQSAFAYTRMTAANVRRAFIDEKGYRPRRSARGSHAAAHAQSSRVSLTARPEDQAGEEDQRDRCHFRQLRTCQPQSG